jgi:hypothetical protein
MHQRYSKGVCACYTFSQKNTHYRNDSVIGNSEWHEEVGFPDRFRITFGDRSKGNSVVFRNDSAINYRGDKFVKARPDTNTLLLLLGGMYYRELHDVTARLKAAGYDLSKSSATKWKGIEVYVIGAQPGDTTSNQFWVDKKDLLIHRIIEKMDKGDMMDMRFESHTKLCKGYIENRVSFRRNGKLEQVEEYYDIKKKECNVGGSR